MPMSNFFPPSQLSNNPFIDGPANAHTRFPDLNTLNAASPGPASYSALGAGSAFGGSVYQNNGSGYGDQGGYGASGLQQQPQQLQYSSYQQPSQPTLQSQPSYGGGPYSANGQFGGASPGLNSQFSGSPGYQSGGYGGYQQQPQSPQYPTQSFSPPPQYNTGYGGYSQPQQQPQQLPPSFIADFDPYANLDRLASIGGSQQQQQQPQYQQQQQQQYGNNNNSSGRTHPRDFIRTHKAELEIWDPVSWKQAISVFDELRVAWEHRKEQVMAEMQNRRYYLSPQEGAQLQAMQKEAVDNIDSIAASSIQMQEVHSGYRQSTDLASRNRVREALNSALRGLPEWPQ